MQWLFVNDRGPPRLYTGRVVGGVGCVKETGVDEAVGRQALELLGGHLPAPGRNVAGLVAQEAGEVGVAVLREREPGVADGLSPIHIPQPTKQAETPLCGLFL